MQKVSFLKLLKNENHHGCFHEPAYYWNCHALSNCFLQRFIKVLVEKHCDCKQVRSVQISASVTVLKNCIITLDISRWNKIPLKKHIETRLCGKQTAKRLSLLRYRKPTKKDIKTTTNFFLSKTHWKKSTRRNCVDFLSIEFIMKK